MTAYIIRRTLYTIPLVLGVCLLTFVLFEVVYTPRARAIDQLQKGASPKDIAETIYARGWGKPLLFNRVSSRVRQDDVFNWPALGAFLVAASGAKEPTPASLVWRRMPDEARAAATRLDEASAEKGAAGNPEDVKIVLDALNVLVGSEDFCRADEFAELGERLQGKDKELWNAQSGELDSRQVQRLNRLALNKALGSDQIASRYYSHVTGLRRLTETRFVDHMKKLLLFEFGYSDKARDYIGRMILKGMGPSLTLTVPIFILSLITGISLSLAVAYFRGTYLDVWSVVVCVVFMSVSILVYIIAGQYLLAIHLRMFPIYGYAPGISSIRFVVLPILIALIRSLGGNVRFYRTIFVEELSHDYVRTARAKGLSEQAILFKHVLKNAMIPILTRTVLAIPFLFLGSLLLERFFGIPGLGNMTLEAATTGDFQVLIAVVYLGALLFALGNLLTDISYTFVDPRVRLG